MPLLTSLLEAATHSHHLDRMSGAVLRTYQQGVKTNQRDARRLAAVYSSRLANRSLQEQLDIFCQAAASLLQAPSAQINLLTDTTQFTVGSFGWSREPVAAEETYCQHTIMPNDDGQPVPLLIENASQHALVCSLSATQETGIRAYLGVPLVTPGGLIIGTLCVFDMVPRLWDERDVADLARLGNVLMQVVDSKDT